MKISQEVKEGIICGVIALGIGGFMGFMGIKLGIAESRKVFDDEFRLKLAKDICDLKQPDDVTIEHF